MGLKLGPSKRLTQRIKEMQQLPEPKAVLVDLDDHVEHHASAEETLVQYAIKENVITDRELADPTELVARRLAGTIDTAMLICVPIAYVIAVVAILKGNELWTLPEQPITLKYTDLGITR